MTQTEATVRREAPPAAPERTQPRLLFFFSPTSGPCRRLDGFLAQVLQRGRNHETFDLRRLDVAEHGELFARLQLDAIPALCVVENGKLRGRLVDPHGAKAVRAFLRPWLR